MFLESFVSLGGFFRGLIVSLKVGVELVRFFTGFSSVLFEGKGL